MSNLFLGSSVSNFEPYSLEEFDKSSLWTGVANYFGDVADKLRFVILGRRSRVCVSVKLDEFSKASVSFMVDCVLASCAMRLIRKREMLETMFLL